MKVNTTIKAILMAALAAISYTIPQAQAASEAEMQSALVAMKTGYTQGDVYALTFTVNTYQGYEGEGHFILLMEPLTFSGNKGQNDGYFLVTTLPSPTTVYLSADDNNPRSYGSGTDSPNTWLSGSWDANTQTNTYTATPQRQQNWLYGAFSQGTNGAHTQTADRLLGATYTVAYDGSKTTIMMTTADGITNKAVLNGVSLNFNDFTFQTLTDGDSGKVGRTAIATGELPTLTKVYTWDGSDALTWGSNSWSLGLADSQGFKSGSDVAFNKEDANTVQADSITAGNVAVNVDQTIVVEGDNVTFGSTTIADGMTLTLQSTGGTIDLGEVSMVGAKLVVDASEGQLEIQSDNDTLEVASMTIDSDYYVGVYTGNPQVEGTVTITESLTAGGATLNANLTLVGHEGDKLVSWDLGGTQMTLGSTLTLDTESGLIQLDNETMLAIAGLEKVGDYVELVLNGGAPGALSYIGDEWFDGVFSRTYTNEEGLETQLTGDYNVLVLDNGNFGIVKFSNVPEPTTGTLSLLALMALAARRRRH